CLVRPSERFSRQQKRQYRSNACVAGSFVNASGVCVSCYFVQEWRFPSTSGVTITCRFFLLSFVSTLMSGRHSDTHLAIMLRQLLAKHVCSRCNYVTNRHRKYCFRLSHDLLSGYLWPTETEHAHAYSMHTWYTSRTLLWIYKGSRK
ncbi:unnamed protein product, partial [Ectocarpus sp. 12 AP-2014]